MTAGTGRRPTYDLHAQEFIIMPVKLEFLTAIERRDVNPNLQAGRSSSLIRSCVCRSNVCVRDVQMTRKLKVVSLKTQRTLLLAREDLCEAEVSI